MLPDLFYTIDFILTIVNSVIGLTFGFLIILIVISHRECRTVTNLLLCNSTISIIFFTIIILLAAVYGLGENWLYYQPACIFRACCIAILCVVISCSYLIQAISRLFFAVFYKYKHLQTYRVHWIMIIFNWLFGLSAPLVMFLINNNVFVLEQQSRLCVASADSFKTAIYCVIVAFVIPFSIILIIYGIIFNRARQSTRRLGTFVPKTIIMSSIGMPNIKREMRLMRNMMILLSLFACAGTPYVILILWHMILRTSPPEPLYLLSVNLILVCIACITIITLFMSKDVKKRFLEYVRKLQWRMALRIED